MWIRKYFPFYDVFPTDETFQAAQYSFAISDCSDTAIFRRERSLQEMCLFNKEAIIWKTLSE